MNIEQDVKLDFCDVLIKPKRSKAPSRSKIDLFRTYKFVNSERQWSGVPIVASNMDTVGTIPMAKILGMYDMATCLHKFIDINELINAMKLLNKATFYTMGITEKDIEKLVSVIQAGYTPSQVCIDVANGYTEFFQDKVKEIRNKYLPDAIIMAGNVATPEMVQELIISGTVDIVKIGIGPGSVCTTRRETGVGYPQLSAIIECADAAHGLGGHVCADGGCVTSGDIAKAFGAGADFVMLGGMLAGHDECEGKWVKKEDGKQYLQFYGMSSYEAMEKHMGGVPEYRGSEGKLVEVPYRGQVKSTIEQILGSLRSTCTYVGAMRLKDLSKCTTFVRVNRPYNTVFGL